MLLLEQKYLMLLDLHMVNVAAQTTFPPAKSPYGIYMLFALPAVLIYSVVIQC